MRAVEGELLRIGVGGIVPVHWDAEKSNGDPGTLTGWASVYNVVDQQDDVVVPGAFRKTISDWRASKRTITLTLNHENTVQGVIGSLMNVTDSALGLKTTFRFASTADAQDARTKAREGHLNGLSIFGPITDKTFETIGGREVRILREVGLWSVGLTPVPALEKALVTAVKENVSATPWGQFSEADYTPEQWRRACLIDTGEGNVTAKSRYKLPVREPSGVLNRNGVHAAAGGHGVGAVTGVSDEVKRAAARKLVGFYRNQLGEDPPERLLRMAGMAASSSLVLPESWVADMRSALAISVPTARKAAVDLLVGAQYGAADGDGDAPHDDPGPVEAEDDAAEYALRLIGEMPNAQMDPIDALLAGADVDRVGMDLKALEAELRGS